LSYGVDVPQGDIGFSSDPVSVAITTTITIPQGDASFDSVAPDIRVSIRPSQGTLAFSSVAPTVTQVWDISPPSGAIGFSSVGADIGSGLTADISPDSRSVYFTTTAPSVSRHLIYVPTGQLLITTVEPQVDLSEVIVPHGVLQFSPEPETYIDIWRFRPRVSVTAFGAPALFSSAYELEPGNLVELYSIDLSPIGEPVKYYWSNTALGLDHIYFDGIEYTYTDIEVEGFEWRGEGSLPEPTLRVTNVNQFAGQLARQYDDLVGAHITRVRTFSQFLDGQDQADATAIFPKDMYQVFQKTAQTPVSVEWKLVSLLDAAGVMLPKRLALKNHCTHSYRIWRAGQDRVLVGREDSPWGRNPNYPDYASRGGSWDYSQATCPYRRQAMFKADGTPTNEPTEDSCGRDLGGCRLRFGGFEMSEGPQGRTLLKRTLPTRAFPGMMRYRIR
jgi:lambda family phage minor tail protein L